MIAPLQPPDSFYLLAAQGWLGLGSPAEADRELEQLAPSARGHPEVLKVRWEIEAARKNWQAALELAATLIGLEPEEPLGWVHRSYCLHELKRTSEARDNLLQVVEKFPEVATIRYNLACYECQLGHLVQAKQWLQAAYRLGDPDEMKRMALEDPDLQPLWSDIRSG